MYWLSIDLGRNINSRAFLLFSHGETETFPFQDFEELDQADFCPIWAQLTFEISRYRLLIVCGACSHLQRCRSAAPAAFGCIITPKGLLVRSGEEWWPFLCGALRLHLPMPPLRRGKPCNTPLMNSQAVDRPQRRYIMRSDHLSLSSLSLPPLTKWKLAVAHLCISLTWGLSKSWYQYGMTFHSVWGVTMYAGSGRRGSIQFYLPYLKRPPCLLTSIDQSWIECY